MATPEDYRDELGDNFCLDALYSDNNQVRDGVIALLFQRLLSTSDYYRKETKNLVLSKIAEASTDIENQPFWDAVAEQIIGRLGDTDYLEDFVIKLQTAEDPDPRCIGSICAGIDGIISSWQQGERRTGEKIISHGKALQIACYALEAYQSTNGLNDEDWSVRDRIRSMVARILTLGKEYEEAIVEEEHLLFLLDSASNPDDISPEEQSWVFLHGRGKESIEIVRQLSFLS